MHAADGEKDFARRAAVLCGGALEKPNPHAWAHKSSTTADIGVVKGAVGVDNCSISTVEARRTEPPAVCLFTIIPTAFIFSTLNYVIRRSTPSCFVATEVLLRFCDT